MRTLFNGGDLNFWYSIWIITTIALLVLLLLTVAQYFWMNARNKKLISYIVPIKTDDIVNRLSNLFNLDTDLKHISVNLKIFRVTDCALDITCGCIEISSITHANEYIDIYLNFDKFGEYELEFDGGIYSEDELNKMAHAIFVHIDNNWTQPEPPKAFAKTAKA